MIGKLSLEHFMFSLRFVSPVVLLAFTAASMPGQATPSYKDNPEFQKAYREAGALRGSDVRFAPDAYKKANKIAGGRCMECLQGMNAAQMSMGEPKDALATAVLMAALADTPIEKSRAQFGRAKALMAQAGEKPKPAQLDAVEGALKESLAAYPQNASALFLEGKVLVMMGKTDEAKTAFRQCMECAAPGDPARLRAEHFAENPALSIAKMAPAFTVKTLRGDTFQLDAMGGRVVLIDFWATWCGPCNEELPEMKKIAKEFAGRPLVIISVSWDSDEAKWKDFIQKKEMTWMQYRDSDHKLSAAFGINAIPHYFTIDSDGVLTAEMVGEGSDVEGKLRKLVSKAEAVRAKQTANNAGGN
jgi:peroxiredoxin